MLTQYIYTILHNIINIKIVIIVIYNLRRLLVAINSVFLLYFWFFSLICWINPYNFDFIFSNYIIHYIYIYIYN